MKRDNIFVTLGMHRSGTSAVTRALQVLGVDLGNHLMPGVQGVNNKGFFEDVDLVKINIRAMNELGLTWDSLDSARSSGPETEGWEEVRQATEGFLNVRTAKHKQFGVKDPRLCRLLPLWQSAFEQCQKRAFGVVAIRHPVSVAQSLQRRDGFSLIKSYYLWLRHVVESVSNSRWMTKRVVIDYDTLMSSPDDDIQRIGGEFGLRINRLELKKYRDEFLDRDLRHFGSDNREQDDPDVPGLVMAVYRLLLDVAMGRQSLDSIGFEEQFAELERRYREFVPLLEYCAMLETQEAKARRVAGAVALGRGQGATQRTGDSGTVSAQSLSSAERLRLWSERRESSISEKALLASVAQGTVSLPSIHVVVLDDGEGALEGTVQSIYEAAPVGMDVHCSVIEGMDAVALSGELASRVEVVRLADRAIADCLNTLCYSQSTDWFLVLRSGAEFTHKGLQRVAIELLGADGIVGVFADEFVKTSVGEMGTGFRPDFNLDLLLSNPAAMARNWLFRRDAVIDLGGFDSQAGEAFELSTILGLIERNGVGAFGHASEPLMVNDVPESCGHDEAHAIQQHLTNRGYGESQVELGSGGFWRVLYGHDAKPLISVVIAAGDSVQRLQRCVETLLEKTFYKNLEIILVSHQDQSAEAQYWFEGLVAMGLNQVRVVQSGNEWNDAQMRNFGASEARGEFLIFMDESIAITGSDWLDALLNHGQRPEVGLVAPKLLNQESTVVDSGSVLGLRGPAGHAQRGADLSAPAYMGRLLSDQNVSAVNGACWMVEKSVFLELGGLDGDELSGAYSVTDFCLRLLRLGQLIVWTPHSRVMLSEEESDDATDQASGRPEQVEQEDVLYGRWVSVIANDPAYNRHLSLRGSGFDIEFQAERQPLPLDLPGAVPKILAHNADKMGCGQYRVIKPFEAMKREQRIEGWQSGHRLMLPEVERINPDVVVLQRQVTQHQILEMRRLKQFTDRFMVYELDDYLPNLPIKSVHRETMPKDVVKSLRQSLQWVDKFVVSTEPLAEAVSSFHNNIEVVENCLPVEWWSDFSGVEQESKSDRPRVGWAGGSGHTGDLELIADVVQALSDEVHWVFFGMCPPKLRPYVHELHEGVDIHQYPAKLASLNLDLALAPLEDNLFNRCKSNLKLLEYGACGYPVVCTDTAPYQAHDMPVTRVRNRFRDWVDAIRDHVANPSESVQAGRSLRSVVRSRWMLKGDNLENWLNAWQRL